jgi:small Trp-rich protein
VAGWSWFAVLAPFALAVAWWAFSDASGHTKRVGMRKDEERKQERRRNLAQGMGLQGLFDRSVGAKLRRAEEMDKATRQRQIDKVESERERKRQANRDSILTTRMDSKFDSRFDAPAQAGGAPGDAAGKADAP